MNRSTTPTLKQLIWIVSGSVVILAMAAYCAPYYAIGDEARVRRELLKIVPPGSDRQRLNEAVGSYGWEITRSQPVQTSVIGDKTYFDDRGRRCRRAGGQVLSIVVAKYPTPFEMTVETLWIFNASGRVRNVCVRKTIDAL